MSLSEWYGQRAPYTLEMKPLRPVWMGEDGKQMLRGGKLAIDEEVFLKWAEETMPDLEYWCQPSFEAAWANLFWYTGDYLPNVPLVVRTDAGQTLRIPRQLTPLAINYINRLTNKRVSDLSIYKPMHDTIPEDEGSYDDYMAARVTKKFLERTKRKNELDAFFNETEKENMTSGFVYACIDWNENKGDRKGPNSKEREGLTEITLKHAWHILPWRSSSWGAVPCAFEVHEILNVHEARLKYKDPNLQPETSRSLFTFESPFIEEVAPDQVVVWRFVYRPDEYLPNGAVIKFTRSKVLSAEVKTYPWSHGELPWERYTDIDIPARFFPMSFYQNLKAMQHTYNNLSGLLKKYIFSLGHPKIIHQRGSVNIKALGNTASLVGVKAGASLPQIMQVKSIGPDPFNFRAGLKEEMVEFSDIHKIGLGDLPPNTRSGIMISRLREIENQQRAPQIDKRNDFMRRVLAKAAAVDGDHIPLTSKKHIERIVGKENAFFVKNLGKIYSESRVIISNSNGFSQEMTGRITEVSAIEKEAGLVLTQQEKRNIIGGVLRERHYDTISAARYTAEAICEMINDGQTPPPPEKSDDLVTHWTVLTIDMQTMAYKRLPERIKKKKNAYLAAVEMLICEIMEKNPDNIITAKVAELEGFPRIFTMKAQPAQPPAPSQPMAQPGAVGPIPGLPPGAAPPMEPLV